MNRLFCGTLSLLLTVLVLGQAGCAKSRPARYYMLTGISAADQSTANGKTGRNLAVGVGPIELPEYLDRPQIVTRRGQHGMQLAEFDRWVEPLHHTFSRVLAENLSVLLSTDNVTLYPHDRSVHLDFQVKVAVLRFDATTSGAVSLVVRWSVIKGKSDKAFTPRVSRIEEQASSNSYSAIVEAQSRALEKLARDIAANLG